VNMRKRVCRPLMHCFWCTAHGRPELIFGGCLCVWRCWGTIYEPLPEQQQQQVGNDDVDVT